MPVIWRLESEVEVRERVRELNEGVDGYNAVAAWEPHARLVKDDVVLQWQKLGRYRAGQS